MTCPHAWHRVGRVDPEGKHGEIDFDRLVLAAGSVNKLLPIPGVAEYAHGFRGISEALYLRDHVTRQLELAAMTGDQDERDTRCTFVVVGGGYTGTEVAAQGQLLTQRLIRQLPALRGQRVRWLLAELAPRLLPELSPQLSRTAERVLRKRGVEVRTAQSVEEARADCLRLTTGEDVVTRSLIWCVGVRPDPVVEKLSLPTVRGRLQVQATLAVGGHPDVFACGDCAAVPDLTRPGSITGMTAQHAQRQGKHAARNVAASLTGKKLEPYRHHDLGFLVDLGGFEAAANPLHVPLSGLAAKSVTRAYHLYSLPGNRTHTAANWAINTVMPPRAVQLGLVRCRPRPVGVHRPTPTPDGGQRDGGRQLKHRQRWPCGQLPSTASSWLPRAARSCRRDVIANLSKILLRCHSTVLGLRSSRAQAGACAGHRGELQVSVLPDVARLLIAARLSPTPATCRYRQISRRATRPGLPRRAAAISRTLVPDMQRPFGGEPSWP